MSWPLIGDPNAGNRWNDWFGHYGGKPPLRYVAQVDTVDALKQAALEGLGVALGRMVTCKSLIDAGRLVVLGDRYLRVPEAYYLVYPPRSEDHRGMATFREWIVDEADSYCKQMPLLRPDEAAA